MGNHWEIVKGAKVTACETPRELFEQACRYFEWCDSNPITYKRTVMAGKDVGMKAEIESTRPYSIKGLCLHCGITEEWLASMRRTKDQESEYFIVISKILYIIYVQNAEYATVGIFNPIFTAKMLNMDTPEIATSAITVNVVHGLPTLSSTENEVLEKLELEKSFLQIEKEQNS